MSPLKAAKIAIRVLKKSRGELGVELGRALDKELEN
jgi:hypothetical protein